METRLRFEFLPAQAVSRSRIQFVDAKGAGVELGVLVDLVSHHEHLREEARRRAVAEDGADGVVHLVLAGEALGGQRRQEHLLHPFELVGAEEVATFQRARVEERDLPRLVVLHLRWVADQVVLHQVLRGALGGATLVEVLVRGHGGHAGACAAHDLHDGLKLVVHRLAGEALGGNAAALDEVQPLGGVHAATGGGYDALHHVGLLRELFLAVQAVARLDDLEHVHELAFVLGALFLAEHGLVRKLHLRHGWHHHFGVMHVGKGRGRVQHQPEVVVHAGAVGLHPLRVVDGLGGLFLAEAQRFDARSRGFVFANLVQRLGDGAADAVGGADAGGAGHGQMPGRGAGAVEALLQLRLPVAGVGQRFEARFLLGDGGIGRRDICLQAVLVRRQLADAAGGGCGAQLHEGMALLVVGGRRAVDLALQGARLIAVSAVGARDAVEVGAQHLQAVALLGQLGLVLPDSVDLAELAVQQLECVARLFQARGGGLALGVERLEFVDRFGRAGQDQLEG
ncbi:hypothetical protein [Variovorax sp. UC74_104]|uniref:hypothetical protein n=1 Tax=Variovorax sp. UC74_104 TaxID=3374555 RepID=UPI003757FA85